MHFFRNFPTKQPFAWAHHSTNQACRTGRQAMQAHRGRLPSEQSWLCVHATLQGPLSGQCKNRWIQTIYVACVVLEFLNNCTNKWGFQGYILLYSVKIFLWLMVSMNRPSPDYAGLPVRGRPTRAVTDGHTANLFCSVRCHLSLPLLIVSTSLHSPPLRRSLAPWTFDDCPQWDWPNL